MMKFSTVGTSWITEKYILAAVNTKKWELESVYSRDLEKGKDFAQNFNGRHVFDDLFQMAEDDSETVYIASPNNMHYEHMKIFISHKKNIICEKPIVLKVEQLQEIYALAKENSVYVIEAFRHINSPGFQVLLNHLDQIGPIRNVTFSYNQYSSRLELFRQGKNPNVFNPAFGGGALTDLGVYPLSLAMGLWGKPKKFIYMPLLLQNGVDGAGTLVLDYGDFLCNITFSKMVQGWIQNEILGEQGAILLDRASELKEISLVLRNQAKVDISEKFYKNDMQHEAETFYRIIRESDRKLYEHLMDISMKTTEIISMSREFV